MRTFSPSREGWLNIFISKGWDVYNSDAVERGRSGFAPPDVWNSEPNFLTKANPFERFRIGQGVGSWNADPAQMKVNAGSQFPVEAYDNFTKQIVPRWTTTDDAIVAAYTALVDKVCPCVLLFHSQAGGFGFTVAQTRPDKIKAIGGSRAGGCRRQGAGWQAEEHPHPGGIWRLHTHRQPMAENAADW